MANKRSGDAITKERGADYKAEIIKLMKSAAYAHDIYRVFNDFLEMSAISISNSVDFTHRDEREKRYLELINGYGKKEQQMFPQMFALLVDALEEKAQTTGPEDILGLIFHELELHNKYKGQFFTPQHISDMMAKMICGDKSQRAIMERGFIHACEPTCGSGVMVTSMCKAMADEHLNYCTQLVVTAADVDLKCVHMTYLQLALYGVPAVVVHANSLTCVEWSRWYTPVYMLNGWVWRQHCGIAEQFCAEDEMIKCALEPGYLAMRQVEALFRESEPPTAAAPIVTAEHTNTESDVYEQDQLVVGLTATDAKTPQKLAAKARRKYAAAQAGNEQISLF